jgi:hypothetical protein
MMFGIGSDSMSDALQDIARTAHNAITLGAVPQLKGYAANKVNVMLNAPTFKEVVDENDSNHTSRQQLFVELKSIIDENHSRLGLSNEWGAVESVIRTGNPKRFEANLTTDAQHHQPNIDTPWLDPSVGGANLVRRRKNVNKKNYGIPQGVFNDIFGGVKTTQGKNVIPVSAVVTNLNDVYARLQNMSKPSRIQVRPKDQFDWKI